MSAAEFDKEIKLSAKEQSDITMSILGGEKSISHQYFYNQVLFNTGIKYYLFGAAKDIGEGIEIAKEQLMGQKGLRQLEKVDK